MCGLWSEREEDVDKADQGPGVLNGTDVGNIEDMKKRWTRRGEGGIYIWRNLRGAAPARLARSGGRQTWLGQHLKVNNMKCTSSYSSPSDLIEFK